MLSIIGTIRDVVLILTGIIGSAFAIYKYKKSREAEAVLQIELSFEVHQISTKNVVDASIQIKNVGKAAAYVGPSEFKKALFMVRKISFPKTDSQLVWEQFKGQQLIDSVEYMSVYGSYYPEEPIVFEPSSTDTYSIFFSTDYHGPIWIRVELVDKDEYKWLTDRLLILP